MNFNISVHCPPQCIRLIKLLREGGLHAEVDGSFLMASFPMVLYLYHHVLISRASDLHYVEHGDNEVGTERFSL